MNINEYIAGAIGGVSGIIVGHPFDTAKIQMQIRTTGDHRIGKMKEAWMNVAAQGLKHGIFRGMMFPVLSYGVVNSTFFGVYGSCIKLLVPDYTVRPSNMEVYVAGCFAGTAQLFLSCPVEVIKCTLQSQIPMKTLARHHVAPSAVTGAPKLSLKPAHPMKYYHGPLGCIVDIHRTQGIFGFYKGFNTMFIRDVPTYGLYLLVYESLYLFLVSHGWSDSNGIVAAIVAGGCAGSASWAVAMPFDVIKSRLQVDHGGRYTGFTDCLRKSVRNAGPSVLFRGTGITMLRAFPVNAVTFLVYSQLVKYLNDINPPDQPLYSDFAESPQQTSGTLLSENEHVKHALHDDVHDKETLESEVDFQENNEQPFSVTPKQTKTNKSGSLHDSTILDKVPSETSHSKHKMHQVPAILDEVIEREFYSHHPHHNAQHPPSISSKQTRITTTATKSEKFQHQHKKDSV